VSPLSPLREGIVIGKKEQILSFLNKKAPALEIDKNAAECLAKKIPMPLVHILCRYKITYQINCSVFDLFTWSNA